MKRSPLIKLVILGTGLVSMTACEDKKNKPTEFHDEQECRKTHTPEECQKALMESKAKHMAAAPKFTSKEECEKQFGAAKCVAAPQGGEHAHGGGGMFMPMMMGFMMGKMMGGGAAPILPASPSASSGWSSASKGPGTSGVQSAAPVQRGGFGSAAPRYSAGS